LIEEGHIDQIIKKAISLGTDPVDAIRMATINPAAYFNLRNKGVVAPGKDADILILKSLEKFEVDKVIIGGEVVFENNMLVKKLNDYSYPDFVKNTVNVKPLSERDFDVKVCGVEDSVRARIIEVIEGEIITNSITKKIKVRNNTLIPDDDSDVLKIAVVERHHKTGNIGLGFVSGFGLKRGAFASSVAHDSHNIIAVGTNGRDMLSAVNKIIEMQGGFSIADNTEIYGLQLNIAGLMSEKPVSEVDNNLNFLQNKLREKGVKIKSAFMALSFLALPVIPKLKLTDRGLFDAEKFMFTDVLVR
jgi:adenine deaminase